MKFVDLYDQNVDLPASERQDRVFFGLPKLVEELGMHLWHPGDSFSHTGVRVLIGVAEYAREDLVLLDVLRVAGVSDRIDVFLLSYCKSQSEVNEYVPGIAQVFHSPVVGVWVDGLLVEKGSGWEGRRLLLSRYG